MPEADPPIVDFKVRNPVTYIKLWWKKIISNEGIDIHLKARPLTTFIVIALLLGGASAYNLLLLGLHEVPFVAKILPTPSVAASVVPSSTAQPNSDWVENAVTGTLKQTPNTNKYYLLTSSYIAITLEFKESLNLNQYLGKRILASGSYNQKTHTLIISDVLDLELIPNTPIPLITPTPLSTEVPQI